MEEVVGYEININDLFNSPPKTKDVQNNNIITVEYDKPAPEKNDEEGIYEYIDEFSKPKVFSKKYCCRLLAVLILASLAVITIIVFLVVPGIFHHTVTATTSRSAPDSTPTYSTTEIPTTTTINHKKTTVASSTNTEITYTTTQLQTTTPTVLMKFFSNTQEPVCGSRILVLLKRYPNEADNSLLVSLIRYHHAIVHVMTSATPSGGSQKETMYTVASKTNGIGAFEYDEHFDLVSLGFFGSIRSVWS
ncbi:unnamed protein product [Caenorhabditis nigoni]